MDLLHDVTEEILEAWPPGSFVSRAAAEAELDVITGWIRERMAGAAPPPPETEDRLLTRRLAEALTAAILERWRGERCPGAEVCMEVLTGLHELNVQTLPDGARDFAGRLADPDGYELVVEMAHDLRSPLTAVTFLAETLRTGHSGPVTELQETQLDLIYSASVGLTAIVSDVVDLAHARGNPLHGDPEAFCIESVFQGVTDVVGPMADAKGIELRRNLGVTHEVLGHPLALNRILANLVINGLKFTEHGWVELSARPVQNGHIEFGVRDTGRGISAENQEKLYEPFRKSSGRHGSFFSSSGLGLSIARRLLLAMDTDLELETRPDWGTRFSFTLELPPAV